MKITTRSLALRDSEDMAAEIGRAFIDAYIHAARHMPFPYLKHVEKRQIGHDVQFILTFEMMQLTTAADIEKHTVTYLLVRSDD